MQNDTSPPDVSAGPMLLGALWLMGGVASIIVILRLCTSAFVLRKVTVPDYLMVITLILTICHNVAITVSVHFGIGRHVMYLSPYQVVEALKWQTVAQPFGCLSPALGRISFAVYLLRIVAGQGRSQRMRSWLIYICIISTAIAAIVCVIVDLARCTNPKKLYDIEAPGACWNRSIYVIYGYFQGTLNTVVDITLTILPMIVIWNVQLSIHIRAGLGLLFSISLFAAVASIVRTAKIHNIATGGDITYTSASFIIWYAAENNIVIIAASIPCIRPLLVRRKRRLTDYLLRRHHRASYIPTHEEVARQEGLSNSENMVKSSAGKLGSSGDAHVRNGGILKETSFTVTEVGTANTTSTGRTAVGGGDGGGSIMNSMRSCSTMNTESQVQLMPSSPSKPPEQTYYFR